MTDHHHEPRQPSVEKPNRWIGPFLLLLVIGIPMVILVVSNTDSAAIAWAGFEWEAPRWLILLATFAAGIVVGPLFGWLWRAWRRRRRRLADEAEVLRRRTGTDEEG